MTNIQPTLFEPDYEPDKIIFGGREPIIKHYDHSLAAMRKPFISWDGEGYTDDWGTHHYWLISNSLGDRIVAPPGRSIERWNIARLFHNTKTRYPSAINVGFALGYDFTMLLRSNGIQVEDVKTLMKEGTLVTDGFVWRLMAGKHLTVYPDVDGSRDPFVLNDTWGFFQRSFIIALDEYFDCDWPNRDIIVEMKSKRSSFDREHDEEVIKYNDIELELHVMLMEELRDRLYQAGMPVSRWYGPGAIATGLLTRWRAKEKMENLYETNPNVAAAAQYAYAGGRFELVKPGHANGPVYQADINSAYPYGLSQVPDLADGEWKHINAPTLDSLPDFSMVRIRWTTDLYRHDVDFGDTKIEELYPRSIPFPLWRRSPQGNISYPSDGIHGWYWLPEIKAAIAYSSVLPASFNCRYSLEEAYAYYPNTNHRPYDTVEILYEMRQKLKARGSGAHIGIKLGLNSLYGKFAQQIGWDEKHEKIPPFHNLAIAGYITSVCRAAMVDAMALAPTSVIAFETDGIFTTKKLDLPYSNALGDWDLTEYDDMWYYQSGFRFGIKHDEVVKPATRGIPAADINLELLKANITNSLNVVKIKKSVFITMRWGNSMNKRNQIGNWTPQTKELRLMAENLAGKRVHDPDCYMCDPDHDGIRQYRWDGPHVTLPASGYEGQLSEAHRVKWSKIGVSADSEPEDEEIEP